MDRRSHTPKGQVARTRILRAAEPLIAAHGFHGTSMRDVAEASRLPLASVVYHFARKETLHATVLGAIAAQVLQALGKAAVALKSNTGASPLDAALRALIRWSLAHPARVRLLMRELLDNPARVSRATTLPLAPVLLQLADVARASGHRQPELAVLHVFGAVSYVVAARPTVRRIVGVDRERQIMETYEAEATAFAQGAFATGAPRETKPKKSKELHHAPGATDRPRQARSRPRRGKDNGRSALG